jgi:signal-transduction protein with cAMP-binding, CBS, and nucleotidyltransferase domain
MDEILNFMRSPVVSIDSQSTAQEGAQLMLNKSVSSLLVKENDNFVGIVTHTDLVREVLATGMDPKTTKMTSVMTHPLITKDHYLTRSDVHEFMLRKKIKHLAVTQEGKIVGILTTKDLLS